MSIEIIRDTMRIDQIVGENSSQALVDGDIIVPDSKPDIARILDVDGKISINSVEVLQDKIMMDGIVIFRILYIADGDGRQISSMDATTNFSHSIEVEGVRPKMDAIIRQEIEHIEYVLMNSRKVNIKAVVDIEGKIMDVQQLDMVREVQGIGDIQVLREKVKNRIRVGDGSSQTIVKEDIEIAPEMPSIKEILKNDAKAVIKEEKIADNRVIVYGDLILSTLYLCEEENEPIQFVTNTVPFSHFVEIEGAYPGLLIEAEAEVQDIFTELRESNSGENRIMDVEMVVGMKASVVDMEEREAITDAYSPSVGLELGKKTVEAQEMAGENSISHVIKETLQMPDGMPKISKVFNVSGKPIMTSQSVSDGIVMIEGLMDASILYFAGDEIQPIQSYQTEIPFQFDLGIENLDQDMDVDIALELSHINFAPIAPDEIEIKAVVNARGTALSRVSKEIITEVKELEPIHKEERGGIIVYFAQPGDDLWAVAKRFNTTVADIAKYNEGIDHQLEVGTRILLYKKFVPIA